MPRRGRSLPGLAAVAVLGAACDGEAPPPSGPSCARDPAWVVTSVAGTWGGAEDLDAALATDGSWRVVTRVGGALDLVALAAAGEARETIAPAGGREPHLLLSEGGEEVLFRDPAAVKSVLWARRVAGAWRTSEIASDALDRRFGVARGIDGRGRLVHSTSSGTLYELVLGAEGVGERTALGDGLEVFGIGAPASGGEHVLTARFDHEGRERLALLATLPGQDAVEVFRLADDRPLGGWSAALAYVNGAPAALFGRDPERGIGLAWRDEGAAPRVETLLPTNDAPAVAGLLRTAGGELWAAAAADGKAYVLRRGGAAPWTVDIVGEATRVFLALDAAERPSLLLVRGLTPASSALAIARPREPTGAERACDGDDER